MDTQQTSGFFPSLKAKARATSWLGPPSPWESRIVTVVSPAVIRAQGLAKGLSYRITSLVIPARQMPTSMDSPSRLEARITASYPSSRAVAAAASQAETGLPTLKRAALKPDRLFTRFPFGVLQPLLKIGPDGGGDGLPDIEEVQNVDGVLEGGGIRQAEVGPGEPLGRGVQGKGDGLGRLNMGDEAPALQEAQVFADRVDVPDGAAAFQEQVVQRLDIGQGDPLGGGG